MEMDNALVEHPSVTVIIPAKNEENNLKICLPSILEAKSVYMGDVDIIVADNGSTDNTVQVAKSFGVTVIECPELSISAMRNEGASLAKSKILAFVDADITVGREWFANGINSIIENRAICVGGFIDVPEKSTWVERTWLMAVDMPFDLLDVEWVSSMNMFVISDRFKNVGGFDEGLITCEDVDLCLRLKRLGHIYYDKSIYVVHHGGAKDIPHFFKKEKWRGQSNLKGIFRHGLSIRELPSVIIPIYYVAIYCSILLYLLLNTINIYFILVCTPIILIPIIRAMTVCSKTKSIKTIAQLFILWFTYYTARGLSLISLAVRWK
jgi:glycosyltransferase involved in cell wall biosynthesis